MTGFRQNSLFEELRVPVLRATAPRQSFFLLGLGFCLALVQTPLVAAEPRAYQITIDGKIAALLPADTLISFSHPSPSIPLSTHKIVNGKIDELSRARFKGKSWNIGFRSPSDGYLFSVSSSKEFFSDDTTITLTLSAPCPRFESIEGQLGIRYVASINDDLSYRDLPCLAQDGQRLGQATQPSFVIVNLVDSTVLGEGKMRDGCMGTRWWCSLPEDVVDSKLDLVGCIVTYDSNKLFLKNVSLGVFRSTDVGLIQINLTRAPDEKR